MYSQEKISVSYVKPVLHLFNTSMLLMKEEDTDLTKNLKKMLHYINEKYKDDATQELLDVASYLDPWFKMDFISADSKPRVKARVASEMIECQEETLSCSTEVEPEVAETSQAKKAKKSLRCFFKQSGAAAKGDSSVTLQDAVEAELSNYLLTPSIDKEQDPRAGI